MRFLASVGLVLAIFVGLMTTWLGLGLVGTSGTPAWVMAGIGIAIIAVSVSKLRRLDRPK
jgi:hypothetical protein